MQVMQGARATLEARACACEFTSRLLLLGLLLLSTYGCAGFGGARMEVLGLSAQRPSQVATYLAVSNGGQPIEELKADSFVVYEDEQPLSASQTQQILQERGRVAEHRTLLLVDVSAAGTQEVRRELARAVMSFAEPVRATQPVTVYAFDGAQQIRLIAELPRASKGSPGELERLVLSAPVDASRNLHGAIIEASDQLARRLSVSSRPLRVGTLVLFAAGPDLAGRTDENAVWKRLEVSGHEVLAIGVGQTSTLLHQLGDGAFIDAHSLDTLSLAFEEAGHRVRDQDARYYLFAYCSPARAGKRQLRLEARFSDAKGVQRVVSASAAFDATGFTSGCIANGLPAFLREEQAEPNKY